MCTHNQRLRKSKKYNIIFHLKINIFTAVKYCCIFHGRVCVMSMHFSGFTRLCSLHWIILLIYVLTDQVTAYCLKLTYRDS